MTNDTRSDNEMTNDTRSDNEIKIFIFGGIIVLILFIMYIIWKFIYI
jgi:t-SNARE complex subunit (syntaxin)